MKLTMKTMLIGISSHYQVQMYYKPFPLSTPIPSPLCVLSVHARVYHIEVGDKQRGEKEGEQFQIIVVILAEC